MSDVVDSPERSMALYSPATTTTANTNTSISLLDLPKELRIMVYELVLVEQGPFYPLETYMRPPTAWKFAPYTASLLRVSKALHDETAWILYGRNQLDFTDSPCPLTWLKGEVGPFLERIGSVNAGYIRHIRVDFPGFRTLRRGRVTLHSSNVLDGIGSCCVGLTTITTSFYPSKGEVQLSHLEDPVVLSEALAAADSYFRHSISSLKEIVVTGHRVDDYPINVIEGLGWTMKKLFERKRKRKRNNEDEEYGEGEDENDENDSN